jgi:hypothetical protein
MRNLTARLDRLEDSLGALGCTCPPFNVLFEAADNPLSRDEIEAPLAARGSCVVHADATGLVVTIRIFGRRPLGGTGRAPIRHGHEQH